MKVDRRGSAPPISKSHAPATRGAAAPTTTPSGWTARSPAPRPSAATSAARLPPAQLSGFDGPAFEAGLDGATHSRSRAGNQVTMLFDGVSSFAERNKLIDGAKESINLQTFIFNSDDTGMDLARRLAAKAQQGVKVKVIYDALGSNRADPKMFKLMRDAGVELRPYGDPMSKPWDLNDRWHEKHLIVDGRTSIEGGMNIANEYALGGSGKQVFSRGKVGTEAWRDTDARLDGPAVHDTQAAFMKNWATLGADVGAAEKARLFPALAPQAADSAVRVVQHRPDEEHDANILNLYTRAIDTAQKSITMENAYFVPPPEVRESLIRAAKRGVEVKVMTNSRASNDMGVVSDAARYFYDDLIKAGVKIFEKQGGTLHSKTATFDGAYSIVGSANMNGRSKGRDSEVVLGIKDPRVAGQMEERFRQGLPETKQVTQAELKHEGFLTNLQQWAMSTLAWTF